MINWINNIVLFVQNLVRNDLSQISNEWALGYGIHKKMLYTCMQRETMLTRSISAQSLLRPICVL